MFKNLLKQKFKKKEILKEFCKTLFVEVFYLWNINKIFCFPNNTIKPYLCLI